MGYNQDKKIILEEFNDIWKGMLTRYVSKAGNELIRDVYAIEVKPKIEGYIPIEENSIFVLKSSPILDPKMSFFNDVIGLAYSEAQAEKELYDYILKETNEHMERHLPGFSLEDRLHIGDVKK